MATGRRRFSPEFKQEAVRLVIEGEKASKVAADWGSGPRCCGAGSTRWWRRVPRHFPGTARCAPECGAVALRRENKILREERDILKKATAFFAAYEKRGSR